MGFDIKNDQTIWAPGLKKGGAVGDAIIGKDRYGANPAQLREISVGFKSAFDDLMASIDKGIQTNFFEAMKTEWYSAEAVRYSYNVLDKLISVNLTIAKWFAGMSDKLFTIYSGWGATLNSTNLPYRPVRFAHDFKTQLKSCAVSDIDGTSAITGNAVVVARRAFNNAELGAKQAFNKALKVIDTNCEALVGADQLKTMRSTFVSFANQLDTTYSSIVQEIIKAVQNSETAAKEYAEIVNKTINDVIRGDYGNGAERKQALFRDGYDVREIQQGVNDSPIINDPTTALEYETPLSSWYSENQDFEQISGIFN